MGNNLLILLKQPLKLPILFFDFKLLKDPLHVCPESAQTWCTLDPNPKPEYKIMYNTVLELSLSRTRDPLLSCGILADELEGENPSAMSSPLWLTTGDV